MAATVITVAQQKGGAGKTTLAVHLAVAWSGMGWRVALVDVDPQGSLGAWHGARAARLGDGATGFHFVAVPGHRLTTILARLAGDHDLIVIDSPPHAETEARIAVRAASLVLVPVQPSPLDLWAAGPTLALAKAERRQSVAVLNRVPPRGPVADEAAAELARMGVAVARSRLGSRTAFARSLATGQGITEAAGNSAGAEEIRSLAAEMARAAGLN